MVTDTYMPTYDNILRKRNKESIAKLLINIFLLCNVTCDGEKKGMKIRNELLTIQHFPPLPHSHFSGFWFIPLPVIFLVKNHAAQFFS